ncbi:hypothetical protein DVH24_018464 [Malus domestica]|uniref:Uncharacterized protein n=1 Tax=Malus domestica TaxID=3750 RepID=A0A498KLB5_MALDO|nr:hypothetical protein DVH24_018464 [Malus domestica]
MKFLATYLTQMLKNTYENLNMQCIFSPTKAMNFLSPKLLPSSSKSSLKLITIAIVLFLYCNAAAVELPNNEKIPAVIVFGDSIVDPGNNNNIGTIVKCNFSPYGRDFVGKRPTGRFSNGRVPSDLVGNLTIVIVVSYFLLALLAQPTTTTTSHIPLNGVGCMNPKTPLLESVGVKKILPTYLDSNLKIQDLLTGVSFASGGSGYDPLTPKIVINAAVGKERTATIVSKSIYIVCTRSNDIANTYLSTPLRRPHYDIPAYTDLMVNIKQLQFVNVSTRKINTIGCVLSQRTLSGGIDKGCSETANQAASLFNSKLSAQIDAFNKRLPETRLVYLDIYNTLLSLIQNPTQYGFEVINRGCCGTGNFEVSILCTRYSPGTCNDSSKYIFWDSYHPSEKGYEVITSLVFDSQVHKFF